jgi:hypothetical protein
VPQYIVFRERVTEKDGLMHLCLSFVEEKQYPKNVVAERLSSTIWPMTKKISRRKKWTPKRNTRCNHSI